MFSPMFQVHYNSKTVPVGTNAESPTSSLKADFPGPAGPASTPKVPPPPPPSAPPPTVVINDGSVPDTSSTGSVIKKPEKKANLYAWVSLQQLSEEMLITPVLLDFLEQALEPIPILQITQPKATKTGEFSISVFFCCVFFPVSMTWLYLG